MRRLLPLLAIALPAPAAAQFPESYQFLKAVREQDGAKVTAIVNRPTGPTIVNTRDTSSGEGALHIVTRNRNLAWLNFLMAFHTAMPSCKLVSTSTRFLCKLDPAMSCCDKDQLINGYHYVCILRWVAQWKPCCQDHLLVSIHMNLGKV